MSLTLTIEGVDYTPHTDWTQVQVNEGITRMGASMTARLELPPSQKALIPQPNREVRLVYNGIDLFAGKVTQPSRALKPGGGIVSLISCVDYTFDLNRRQAVEAYQGITAGQVVRNLITSYLAPYGISAGNIEDGPVLSNWAINYEYVRDSLERLARATGFEYFIDYNKQLHFYNPSGGFSEAPWNLTEAATAPYERSASFQGLNVIRDISQIRNDVVVRGAKSQSAPVTEQILFNGVQSSFNLTLGNPVRGSLSFNIDGMPQLVGEVGQVDPLLVDWLVDYSNRSVRKTATGLTPAAGSIGTVTYRYQSQIIVNVRSQESINSFRTATDDGMFSHVIVSEDIETRDQAIAAGRADLRENSIATETVSYSTTRPGLKAGMVQRITIPRLNIDNRYLIRSCRINFQAFTDQQTAFQAAGYQANWTIQGERVYGTESVS
jgi:hypothetical protein